MGRWARSLCQPISPSPDVELQLALPQLDRPPSLSQAFAILRKYLPPTARPTALLPGCCLFSPGSIRALPPGAALRLEGLASLGADLPADLPHLAGQVSFYVVPPHDATRAILIGAVLEPSQLLPPLPRQCIEPYQFGLELRCVPRFAILHHESEVLQ